MRMNIRVFLGIMSCGLVLAGCDDPEMQPADEPVCGNAVREEGEACDGLDTGPDACGDAGFPSGLALCRVDCTLDTSWCSDGACANRLDDHDGGYDCDDVACLGRMGCPPESCVDGVDNDGDEMIDCMDPDCASHAPGCNAGCTFAERDRLDGCADGYDSDCDGLTDGEDPDCDGAAGLLLAFSPGTGRPTAGASVLVVVTFLADDGALPASTITWAVPEGLDAVVAQDGGAWSAQDRTVSWTTGALAQGEWFTVHALARIAATAEAGDELCLQARFETDPPRLTDVPDLPGAADPVCFDVVQ